uniref:DUF1501 domain-containing protein n=1 Tax=Odontella aurita TaxID=265563 RepID=A0A7S4JX61_9STRA
MNYARVWTGFDYQKRRGNAEEFEQSKNRLDPMRIEARWRDKFPKRTLNGGYIGDHYPLCVDMPLDMFLRNSAKYRFLGSSRVPELMNTNPEYLDDDDTVEFVLDANSLLRDKLCEGAGVDCSSPTKNEITLEGIPNGALPCTGQECDVDAVRVVKVADGTYWEYVRPACVEQAFYEGAKKLSRRNTNFQGAMCANPLLPAAFEACCLNSFSLTPVAHMNNLYDDERVTLATARDRCASSENAEEGNTKVCDYDSMSPEIPAHKTGYHWTDEDCSIGIKVTSDEALPGWIAIVYSPEKLKVNKAIHVDDDTLNFFPVNWEGGAYPSADADGCGDGCVPISGGGGCRCGTSVVEGRAFDAMPSSADEAFSRLFVGSVDVTAYPALTYELQVDEVTGIGAFLKGGVFGTDTVFAVPHANTGRTIFLKNIESTVRVGSSGLSFRNVPHFVSMIHAETDVRDAQYETEAALEHYFYQDNLAPFVATRFIQRLGVTSNPAPAYVKSVATAFRSGTYDAGNGNTFGEGKYGDLAATVAAVLLDREARSVVVDADPAAGQLRAPLLKILAALRNLDFAPHGETDDLIPMRNLAPYVGQAPHEFETVFSHFLWDYIPAGRHANAAMYSPEAQVLDMPKITSLINGLFSLIRYDRLGNWAGGFGTRDLGRLLYEPPSAAPARGRKLQAADGITVVDDLATLMTSGRLGPENRKIIADAYDTAVTSHNTDTALMLAQQLIFTSPEFHATSIVTKSGKDRSSFVEQDSTQDPEDYKSVVYLLLAGGCDSYNMLVPVECEEPETNETSALHDQYYEVRGEVALVAQSLHPLEATDQICSKFGLHNELGAMADLYNDGDALFVANTGSMSKPVSKTGENNWRQTVGGLFSHNTMQNSAKMVDLFEMYSGTGVLGRLRDMLNRLGHKTSAISVNGQTVTLIGRQGQSAGSQVVSSGGVPQFNPSPLVPGMNGLMSDINNATEPDSGIMGEKWSEVLHESLSSNQALREALDSTTVENMFPNTGLGRQLQIVSRLMQTADVREITRDMYYVAVGGYDTHSMVEVNLANRFREVDGAIEAFAKELKAKGLWENTVLVETSDFARTLTPNSGKGTDHAWGGNYFMLGGGLRGGNILGTFPHDITPSGPYNIGRGRLIATTPWDSIFNGIAEWMGISGTADLTEVCPNRNAFPEEFLFKAGHLFNTTAEAPLPNGGGRGLE